MVGCDLRSCGGMGRGDDGMGSGEEEREEGEASEAGSEASTVFVPMEVGDREIGKAWSFFRLYLFG